MHGRYPTFLSLIALAMAGMPAAEAQSLQMKASAGPTVTAPASQGQSQGPAACADTGAAFGRSRTVEIDASAGPIFGSLTRQAREPSFLKPNEVVLTFDDGPMPWVTKSILDTLDSYCAKATFFSVGKMALAYPATVRDLMARGHTLGTHTYSHPFNMPRMKHEAAAGEIERGIAAVTTAAGEPIAPFFRFTGLSDSSKLMAYLQSRGIAAFTVDVVSNDSYTSDPAKLADRTMAEIAQTKGGIVLFHDIKTATAKALPVILSRLKAQGYTIVHITAKRSVEPLADAMREVAPKLARAGNGEAGGRTLLPFYGAIGPVAAAGHDVTAIAPEPRVRAMEAAKADKAQAKPDAPQRVASKPAAVDKTKASARGPGSGTSSWLKQSVVEYSNAPVRKDASVAQSAGGWVTNVVSKAKPIKANR